MNWRNNWKLEVRNWKLKTSSFKNILFFLIVFCLSFQVGLHFWPEFAYITGVRIDYLSPTLYLLDILVISFIVLSWGKIISFVTSIYRKIKKRSFLKYLIALLALDLLLNIFFARSPGAHIFGIIKLLEFALFAISVMLFFEKKHIRYFIDALCISAIISSVLAIWQFVSQSSIGGLWYLIGERSFSSVTIGISTVNLNSEILRPYAAFPHPNILAFFLFTTVVFAISRIPYETIKKEKIFLLLTSFVSSVALFLTLSRSVIALIIVFLIYAIYTKGKRNKNFISLSVIGIVGLIGLLGIITQSSFFLRGLDFRAELFDQSLKIFSNNLYFGIGLNNFFIHQVPFIKEISPIVYQPPHNIYLLGLLQLGLFGFLIFPYLLFLAVSSLLEKQKASLASESRRAKSEELKAFYKSTLIVVLGILFVGLFDHFFLTLEQGQLMLALFLGLSLARLKI